MELERARLKKPRLLKRAEPISRRNTDSERGVRSRLCFDPERAQTHKHLLALCPQNVDAKIDRGAPLHRLHLRFERRPKERASSGSSHAGYSPRMCDGGSPIFAAMERNSSSLSGAGP